MRAHSENTVLVYFNKVKRYDSPKLVNEHGELYYLYCIILLYK